jgi:1,2-dihydroxy-3-keto-5-methylthiopentene dioxygenase
VSKVWITRSVFEKNFDSFTSVPPLIAAKMVQAWFMDSSDDDQRLPHQLVPNKEVSLSYLAEFGVLYWHFEGEDPSEHAELAKVKVDRGYTYTDTVRIHPSTLPDYEKKLKIFFEEHLHLDEEIRLCLEGSGYFDVRDKLDRWVRIAVEKGDMIILPAGMYHRFTLDSSNFIKALRLFVGEPIWTPYNRVEKGVDELPARSAYIKQFLTDC